MGLLKSGSILILVFALFRVEARAQQVISEVAMEKKANNHYRIRYSLHSATGFDIEKADLKIYRRRNEKVEEIFSVPLTISMPNDQNQSYTFDWTASNDIIQKGDELKAKVILSLKASAARQRLNRIPVADAGSFTQIELPFSRPVELNGIKSHDDDGKIIFVEWKQVGGPNALNIVHKDSLVAYAEGEFKAGTYAFELTVKDNLGSVASSRTSVTVKGPSYWTDRPATINPPQKTKTPPAGTPQKNPAKLKGGPSNAALNLLLPGLGHYFVSGNHKGENRKASAFIITGVYAASIGGAYYFNSRSNDLYDRYKELASYREYQKDANGLIIGVRGASEAEADKYYNDAKAAHRNALICLGVGGGVWVGDLVFTLLKGNKNKKEWQSQNTSFKPDLFISSDGYETTAGIKISF